MITPEDIQKAQDLLVAAYQYNDALREAFVSTEQTVELTLPDGDGGTYQITLPTYHALVMRFQEVTDALRSMQIDDVSGQDAIQMLLSDASSLLLYLHPRRQYIQKPLNAVLSTVYIAKDFDIRNDLANLVLKVDLSAARIPIEAKFAYVQYDNDEPMLLPIKTATHGSKVISGVMQIIDNMHINVSNVNTLNVGDDIFIRGEQNKVQDLSGLTVELEVPKSNIVAGDDIYSSTTAKAPYIDVPILVGKTTLKLAILNGHIMSEFAEYLMAPVYNLTAPGGGTVQANLSGTTFAQKLIDL